LFYILYGTDNFSIHNELKKIKSDLGDADMLAINTNVLDGEQLTPGELQDICSVLPFLHQVRLVIVENLLSRFEPDKKAVKRAAKAQTKSESDFKQWKELKNYVIKMTSSTVLVFLDGALSQKNGLLKELASVAEVKFFPQLKGNELHRWIRERVVEGGGRIAPQAINLLDELVGGDLWNMSNEIEKLLTFAAGNLITENDIRQVTSYTREANIFAFVDALLEGHRKEAQGLLHRLLKEGAVPMQILTMVTRQLRMIVMLKETHTTEQKNTVMSMFGITSGYIFSKISEQARKSPMENIKNAYYEVLKTDLAIKTGTYDDHLAIDMMVLELCKGQN
jgi:DNA polymerase-3 subunit delta